MTTLYKLTDASDCTHGDSQWGPGVTIETSGEGELCGPGFTHWYTHPLLAVLLNPIHGGFDLATAHLWKGKGKIAKTDNGLKVGCTRGTTLRRVPLPSVTTEQRVRFAVLCARTVYRDPQFLAWAEGWLNCKNRTAVGAAARAAARAARAAARAAAGAAINIDLSAMARQATAAGGTD